MADKMGAALGQPVIVEKRRRFDRRRPARARHA
jgi:hypothetical protein